MNKLHILKDNPALPDYYGLKLLYIDGKSEDFQVAFHRVLPEIGMLEFVTDEDLWFLRPISNLKGINFDKSFSAVIAAKEEKSVKRNETAPV